MGRGGAPAREISFVSLLAYGPKVCHSALAMGVYSFWNQAGKFPTKINKNKKREEEGNNGVIEGKSKIRNMKEKKEQK